MVNKTIPQNSPDLFTLSQTLAFDLPLTLVRWGSGMGSEAEATTTAWKAYDAGIRLATEAVDTLYRSPLFSESISAAFNQFLRWQSLGNAATNLFFSSLLRNVGLPTASEVEALTHQIVALENRLHTASQVKPDLDVQAGSAEAKKLALAQKSEKIAA